RLLAARLARVTHAIVIGVRLIGVRRPRTVVAGIPMPVVVGVARVRGNQPGAAIQVAAHAVSVGVVERVVWTDVAGVADAITVGVELPWIGDCRTVVDGARVPGKARVTGAVPVQVLAGVAGIPDAVVVEVLLAGVRPRRAVVARVAEPVPIRVHLIG